VGARVLAAALLGAAACAALTGCASAPPAPSLRSVLDLPATDSPPRPPGRVVLISVAGMTPDLYTDAHPAMPAVAQLAHTGIAADAVVPVVPASSYPAHASLVTGRRPDAHGVASDLLLGERGVRDTPYWHASLLRAPTLWETARAARLSVAALGWPSTTGAAVDLLVPDLLPVQRGETWPSVLAGAATPWLYERIASAAPRDAGPEWPDARQRDELLVDLACEIARMDAPPQLWLLALGQTGVAVARYGPGSPAAHAAFGRADAQIKRLVDCFAKAGLLDSTALFVAGDRALAPVHTEVDPNVALWRAGLITGDPRAEPPVQSWSAIARSNGGSAFVYARGEGDAVDARQALQEEAERTHAFRVVSARELQRLHADPHAWFGLEAEPGFAFGDRLEPPDLRPAPLRATGGYLPSPQGVGGGAVGLAAWGPGLRRGVRVPRMEQIDVAPTIASLLGIRLPDADGRALVGLLSVEPASGVAWGRGPAAHPPAGPQRGVSSPESP
jgi:predicted AlkP superfamily pyrophosphatase or phosphodiesterase